MSLIDIIFPKNCLECGSAGKYICISCITKVRNQKGVCLICNKPSIDGFTHIKCQRKYGIDGLLSIWKYEGIIRKSLIAVKYKYATEVAKELMNYIEAELQSKKEILGENVILVPIPLHWYRENYRGFNQSELLGKEAAKIMGWKFIPDILVKKKFTIPQVGLEGKQRTQNIRNVFAINNNITIQQYNNLIIFDDVYTTGSTIKEAAKVLKRAGAKSVWGLTVAR